MKIIKYITLIFVFALSFMACTEDEDLTTIDENNFVAPVISGIVADEEFVLVKDTTKVDSLKKVWVDLTWTKADYGQPLATSYTIQIDKVGSSFANPIEFRASSNTELSILVEEVNSKMFDKGSYYPPLVEVNVEIRIMAEVSESIGALYSSATPFYVTPFDAGKPKLYVTGSHQPLAWDFASAQTLYSINEDKNYEGYIYLTANCEYKLNKTPDIAWGDGGAGLITLDGGNISNTVEGMYWMEVDTLAETLSTTLRNWGIIGSATPGGWDTDTDMEYDYTTGKLKATVDLTAAEMKFRANDAWSINLGDDDADGSLEQDGANIVISEAGNYTVYLDLSNPGRLTYELIKN